jgi:predicted RNA binding protein YcfA (HicA-like mRNA interferase family)
VKLRDLERQLASQGCHFEREGANHTLWKNPAAAKISPVPRHREIKEGTVRAICRQLKIPKP